MKYEKAEVLKANYNVSLLFYLLREFLFLNAKMLFRTEPAMARVRRRNQNEKLQRKRSRPTQIPRPVSHTSV
jgi:hypothetical protein